MTPIREAGMPSGPAKNGPSGSTIMKSRMLTNWIAPIRKMTVRSPGPRGMGSRCRRRCQGFGGFLSVTPPRPPPSRRRLFHGLRGPCRDLLAERLLDERHEDRSPGTRDVGAEDLAALQAQDARAVELDRQLELRPGPVAQERDHALRAGRQLERSIGVGGEDRARHIERTHDGEE